MKRHPNDNGGMIPDPDSPVKWHNVSIYFEDGSSIKRNLAGEIRHQYSISLTLELSPLTMAQRALSKYNESQLNRTFSACLWAWEIIFDTDVPCGWRKHHEKLLRIRDAMLDLFYGEEVSAHADE